MGSDGKRICDRCGREITSPTVEQNPHNLILVGWMTEGGSVTNERYDICTECADLFEEWMSDCE